ncbi:MAG TPA: DUF1295 domain-containing protein [Candidatus Didemnitutus sp.]|nr:DUF1295 domain-containing protein [Candidatus Didemnitutus sp.]
MLPLALVLFALAGAAAIFAIAFALARRVNNFGIVDVVWSLGFAPLAGLYAWASSGLPLRRTLIAAMAIMWSLRLGGHLARRVLGHLDVEDARYAQLRRDWAGRFELKMFDFFQLQALLLVVLATPFLLAAANPAPALHPLELAGVVLAALAVTGEAVADAQLAAFKRNPARRGQVCDVGLWRWSRHPNYFFEWLVWVAFALFALPAPHGWLALGSPVLMLHFLLRVTGIPYTEAQLLRSKGDAYRRYQQRTSAFFPWLPARPPTSCSSQS